MRLACTSSVWLALLVAASASLLLAASAVSGDEERAASEPDAAVAPAVLWRQRRNPLLIPAGVAVARIAGRYAVTIGREVYRNFRSRKAVEEFLRQPSTLRKINNLPATHGNVVNVPSKTMAKDLAKRLNDVKKAKPVHHAKPNRGDPHFHPVDKAGKLKPQHVAHPKPVAKTRTKYSSGAKQRAADKVRSGSSNAGKSKVGGSGGGSKGGSKGGSRGGSKGGSKGGSRGGSKGGSTGGSKGGSRGGGSRGGGSRGGSGGGKRG